MFRPQDARVSRVIVGGLAALATFVAGGAAYATSPFTDVANNSHAADIDAIHNAGITAGCTANAYCPDQSVRRDQMATFLARAAGLNTATVKHPPVLNARGPVQSYCSYQAAESAVYRAGPCRRSVTTAFAGSNAGQYSSIAIGSDELPIISFWDTANGDLRTIHCGNNACTSALSNQLIDPGNVGQFNSIAIGTDGMPLIAYPGDGLNIVRCGDLVCQTHTKTNVDAANNVGGFSSIAVPPSGLPVVAYLDATNGDLKVAQCTSALCDAATTTTADNSTNNVGQGIALAIGADGLPFIAYVDATAHSLLVMHCGNESCTSNNTISTGDNSGNVSAAVSLAIGADGLPIASYYNTSGNQTVKVLHCETQVCETGGVMSLLDDGSGNAGRYNSIVSGTDGLPVVYFSGETAGDLLAVRCLSRDCSSAEPAALIDTAGDVGQYVSAAVDTTGLIVVSYYDTTNRDLKVTAS